MPYLQHWNPEKHNPVHCWRLPFPPVQYTVSQYCSPLGGAAVGHVRTLIARDFPQVNRLDLANLTESREIKQGLTH